MSQSTDLTRSLLDLSRALRAAQGARLVEHGLHPGQDALMIELWDRPGPTQAGLATRLGVEPPTVARMVARLERGGLVERRRDRDDGRRMLVHPTARSRLLEGAVRACWEDLAHQLADALGDSDARELSRLATLSTRALGKSPANGE